MVRSQWGETPHAPRLGRSSFQLRRGIEPADRPRIEALLASLEAFTPDERLVALELVDDRLAGSDDYRFIVADAAPASEQLAGYLCYGRTPLTLTTYDLYWIATSPAHVRRGVGRALVEAMEGEIAGEGGGLVRVETGSREGHGAAVRFYEATGFERAAVLPGFYAPDDDLLVVIKRVLAKRVLAR